MPDVAPPTHIVPIQKGQCTATITPKWFVNGSEYHPQLSTFRPLVNGEEAFDAVYRAIDAAKKSVCIICWGFQPSMYFVRGRTQMMIGQLLEEKARQGKMVRVLCWAFEKWMIKRINVTGFKHGLNESNTPGRWLQRISDRPATETDDQYRYDIYWYSVYDRKAERSEVNEYIRKQLVPNKFPKDNLLFYSRSYSISDTARLATLDYIDKDLELEAKMYMQQLPSHHQKMVMVDYEDPQSAVGFVMGHNMLDFYWDTPDHSGTPKPPNVGRNGHSPLHDYSSRVTGPIIGDLFRNFAHAWKMETGDTLPEPNFCTYPLLGNDEIALCQILRTQPQTKSLLPWSSKEATQDIAKCYLQAVSNATQCIVIENQYFRWPPLATKITESAAKMTAGGRSPEKHGYLYLFVITNSSDGGIGAGTVNTYRMLEALGRADRLPEVARHQRAEAMDREIKAVEKDLKAVDKDMKSALGRRDAIDKDARLLTGIPGANINARYGPIQEEIANLEARKAQLEARKRELERRKDRLKPPTGSKREGEAIMPREVPGLKVHIATLVAPDTADKEPWQEVYIHAKLTMIDDTFLTLGSTNINTRSMQTDTELNIMHDRYEITKPLRERQWEKYTSGKDDQGNGVTRVPTGTPLKEAFSEWGKLMNDNATAKNNNRSPLAQLHEFLRTNDAISNKD